MTPDSGPGGPPSRVTPSVLGPAGDELLDPQAPGRLDFLSGRESPEPLRLLALFLGKVFSDFAGLSHSVLLALSMIE
jgi:hypothetical protein